MHLVCSVVLTSGPDEALMCRCARVVADWSSEPRFAKELGTKEAAGRSLAALMRSVSPKTKAGVIDRRYCTLNLLPPLKSTVGDIR